MSLDHDFDFDMQVRLERLERYESGMDLRRLILMGGWETLGEFCADAGVCKTGLSRVLRGHDRGSHAMFKRIVDTLAMPGFDTVPSLRALTKLGGASR